MDKLIIGDENYILTEFALTKEFYAIISCH